MPALYIFLGFSAYILLGVLTLILYTYVCVLTDTADGDEDYAALVIMFWPLILLLSIVVFTEKASSIAYKKLINLFQSLKGENTMHQPMTVEQRTVTNHIHERNNSRGCSIVAIADGANEDATVNHIRRLHRFGRDVRVLKLGIDPDNYLSEYCKTEGGVEQVYIFGDDHTNVPKLVYACKNRGIPCFVFKED